MPQQQDETEKEADEEEDEGNEKSEWSSKKQVQAESGADMDCDNDNATKGKKILLKFISSRDGPVESTETGQGYTYTSYLLQSNGGKKDKKTTLHLLYRQQM